MYIDGKHSIGMVCIWDRWMDGWVVGQLGYDDRRDGLYSYLYIDGYHLTTIHGLLDTGME